MFNNIATNISVTDLKNKISATGVKAVFTLLIALVCSFFQELYATHLRAGEIIVRRVNCEGRTFEITVIVYTDTGSEVRFGEGILDFGDGSEPFILPVIENGNAVRRLANGTFVTSPIDVSGLGNEVSSASFTIEHTYSSALPFYTVGYTEQNRNDDIQNVDNNTPFHIETQISLDASLGCNNSPVLSIPPIDRACPGVAFFHNPGAFDPDNDLGERDSLAFELVIPKMSPDDDVASYVDVTDPSFYSNFQQGNEAMNGPPEISIDPITGEITWDAPGFAGEYTIAFVVREFRFRFGQWFPIGFVRRDMQIIVEDCDNERPELIDPEDICVEAGTTIDETILGIDPDGDDVTIDVFPEDLIDELGIQLTGAGVVQPSVPSAAVRFVWDTECLDIRDQPYQIFFRITDHPEDGPRLVSFETWNITVVAPSPQLNEVVQEGQALRLNWDSYECQNADEIQIWRRVDSNPYVPDECETGIRENAGYELIATVPDAATTFRDENVDAAAKYCYRLVAGFLESAGGGGGQARNIVAESIVSEEVCFEFVPAEEPVITHVSVNSTSETNGEIIVAWHAPLDSGTLTPPFTYRIERAEGFSGETNLTLVDEITVNDLNPDTDSIGFVDTGLNTLDQVYNYRITLVDPNSSDDLVSATASSVRLEATPQFGQIELNWTADVPWSNTIAFPPGSEHLIYRGLEGDTDDELEFLAAVDVNQSGFTFTDDNNLDDEQIYCYRVLTKGTYGNPDIQGPGLDPLLNFSQMVCAQPSDSIPPCAPVLTLEARDCQQFIDESFCNFDDYRNLLNWTTDFIGDCQEDVRVYRIFYAATTSGDFALIDSVTTESFIHENLSSFKGCYRIQAVDRSGNVSDFSNTVCVDNCPNYILPNIFTPENEQFGNHLFRAFTVGDPAGPAGEEQCARFVEAVDFTVYNRWGKPVFTYQGSRGSENSILINWDGKNDNGVDLASGVYYYLARVTFDTVDPGNSEQDIKGWVQLIR